jgi:hypothetical protein
MAKKKWPRLGGMDDGTRGEQVDINSQSWPPAPDGVELQSSTQRPTRFSILFIGCMVIAILFIGYIFVILLAGITAHRHM